MARFRVGQRVRIAATGETGVIRVEHPAAEPRKYTVRVDSRTAAARRASIRPLDRIYTESELEPDAD
jgi:hypothetical protein